MNSLRKSNPCQPVSLFLSALLALAAVANSLRAEALHYPTDIYAGRVLAQAIVREMKSNPDFQRDFADAKSEIAVAQL